MIVANESACGRPAKAVSSSILAGVARMVGYWRGVPPIELLGLPDPAALVAPAWEADRREQIVAYLRAGVAVAHYAGYSSCRFADCRHPERARLGSKDLSDGAWIWPEGLWHYVRDHAVRLPDELVAGAAARDFTPPARLPPGELSADPSFWLRWSAEHTAPPPVAADACSLDDARTTCAALSTGRWRATVVVDLGRWRLELATDGDLVTDYSAPISALALREYLFATRRPDDAAVLPAPRATELAAALARPGCVARPFASSTSGDGRVWWAVLSSGGRPTRRFEDLDLRAIPLPEPGNVTFLPGNWKVEVTPAMDEPAWRFFVERWLRDTAGPSG